MAVSKRLRFEVFRRDNFACRYCGQAAVDGAVLEPDHVVPRSRGGKDVATNLVTACADCNSGKSNTPLLAPLIDDVPQDAFRRACADRGIESPPDPPPQPTSEDLDPSSDRSFYAGRVNFGYQVLHLAEPWDRQNAFERALAAAAPYEPTSDELHACAGLMAAEGAFEDLWRLSNILMDHLWSLPHGQAIWDASAEHVKNTRDRPTRSVDVIAEAAERALGVVDAA